MTGSHWQEILLSSPPHSSEMTPEPFSGTAHELKKINIYENTRLRLVSDTLHLKLKTQCLQIRSDMVYATKHTANQRHMFDAVMRSLLFTWQSRIASSIGLWKNRPL